MPNGSAPLRAMAGAAAEALNGVGDEQVRRWRIWRAGAICCSRGGLQRRSGRLPDILETARPSSGVFWPRQVGVSGLIIFPIIPFACRFDLVFGLIWLQLLLRFGYDCAGRAYGRLRGTTGSRRAASSCLQRGWARGLGHSGSRATSIRAQPLAHPADLVPLGTSY